MTQYHLILFPKQETVKSTKKSQVEPLPIVEPRRPYQGSQQICRYHVKSNHLVVDKQKLQQNQSQESKIQDIEVGVFRQKGRFHRKVKKGGSKPHKKYSLRDKLERQSGQDYNQPDPMRRQFDQIKPTASNQVTSNTLSRQRMALSSIMQCLQKQMGCNWQIVSDSKHSNRAAMYEPFRKKSQLKEKQKQSASENHIVNPPDNCMNVEKLVLIDGALERPKNRSNTYTSTPFGDKAEEKIRVRKGTKEYRQSIGSYSLIKDLNHIKQKLNISKVLALHEEMKSQESISLKNSIKVSRCAKAEGRNAPSKNSKSKDGRKQGQEIQKNNCDTIEEAESARPDILQEKQTQKKLNKNRPRRIKRRFIPPFETYHYRDMLWKVNYSNSIYIQVPLEYQHRLRVFVGKGNNSCMVRGLLSRRTWLAFTDRIEQAQFVWNQIKNLSYFKKQEPTLTQSKQEEMLCRTVRGANYKTRSLLTEQDFTTLSSYMIAHQPSQEHNDQRLLCRLKYFRFMTSVKQAQLRKGRMQNHFINNYVLGNKKALFNTMNKYYLSKNQNVFDYLPLTFHIKDGLEDKKYFQFLRYYHKRNKQVNKSNAYKNNKLKQKNAWIVKPGQNSNRGQGIKMCLALEDIKTILKQKQIYSDGSYRTYILQSYIERPLLYQKRKIDLRHYMMMTCINGTIKGYWYRDGYVRTTSTEYSLSNNGSNIHLTNDAVQKNLPEYGKYEKGNKLSYDDLATYIDKHHKKKNKSFYEHILPKMKEMATDCMRACSGGIDPDKLCNNFQIFGLDFMIDANLDVWLIEVNTNPCLELSCPLLSSLIPRMIENTLQLTLDCMYPPPVRWSPKGVHYFKQSEKENRYELVYDERVEGNYSGALDVLDSKLLEEEEDVFEDSGDQWQED